MHTRCPECRTTFVVKPGQLQARDGLVRCGRCLTVFRAEKHRVAKASIKAGATSPKTVHEHSDPGTGRKTGKKPAAKTTNDTKRRPKIPAEAKSTAAKTAPESAPLTLLDPVARPRTRLPFWMVGNITLVLLLLAQGAYFYSGDLVFAYPALKPAFADVCRALGCQLTPPQDINLIDLVEAKIAPHPKFDKALRIRATLVNRAHFKQTFPIMEVTLSDTRGQIIARRAFKPEEYVEKSRNDDVTMAPHVAIPVLLDVTHPGNRALSYEIRLLAVN